MIRWILFSTLATALFYVLYHLLFRRDSWLQLSRWYLISTLAFSLLYPFFRLPDAAIPPFHADVLVLPDIEYSISEPTPEPLSMPQEHVQPSGLNTGQIALIVYLVGAAISLFLLLTSIVRLLVKLHRLPYYRQGNIRISLLDDDAAPYSFFNHIVVGTKGIDERQLQCLLAHEELHVRQRHTIDLLSMRMMCCIAWFNPFAWLMLHELRAVHEYLADGAVLSAHDRKNYLGLLYQEAAGTGYGRITNNFKSINIKNRITMMNKQKSRYGAWKLIAVLPMAALLTAFGCLSTGRGSNKAIPDGVYTSHDYADYFKDGRLVGRDYHQIVVPLEELLKVEVVIGNKQKIARAMDKLSDGFYYVELNQMHPDVAYPQNKDVDLWELWVTNDPDTWLARKKAGLEYYTEPQFEGGIEALRTYLQTNIHYPEQAKQEGIKGTVYVSFIIETDGSIGEIEVIRTATNAPTSLEHEALRVVEAMPNWKPATFMQKNTRSCYVLPITFSLR